MLPDMSALLGFDVLEVVAGVVVAAEFAPELFEDCLYAY